MTYGYHFCRICLQEGKHTWTDVGGMRVCSECGQYCDHGVPSPGAYSDLFRGNTCSECGFICDHRERDVGYNHFYGYLGARYDGESASSHRCDLCGTEEMHQWTMSESEHTCFVCQAHASHDFMSTGTGACAQCGYACTHANAMGGEACPDCGMWLPEGISYARDMLPSKRKED